jgi:Holliday junction resolvasome RuvABC endonuclease subunit
VRLTAFDPGTRLLGFCYGDGSTLPTAGAWAFPQAGDNLGKMLCAIDDRLAEHFDTYQPECVAYESPILMRWDKLGPLRKTYSLGAHIEFMCERRGIPCFEVDLKAVKRELAGHHDASKKSMVYAAEKLGVILPKGPGREDAADALGAWLTLLRAKDRHASSRFDQALWSARGSVLI